MTQYNSLNVNLSSSQLNKIKSAIKNETEVVLKLSPNMIGDSNDETNFPHKLLLTDRQVSNFLQIFLQLISNFQKLNYQKWCSEKDYLINHSAHY